MPSAGGLNSLTAISPVDGRYAKTAEPLRRTFSEYGLIRHRVRVEVAWLRVMAECPEIAELPPLSAASVKRLDEIEGITAQQAERVKEIERTTNHDMKAVEYWIKEQMDDVPDLKAAKEMVHFSCTSEDINNLAYGSMLLEGMRDVVIPAMQEMVGEVRSLAKEHADVALLALTHGQPATPTTFGKEMANFVHRFERHLKQMRQVEYMGKFNGAVGNFNAHSLAYPKVQWPALAQKLVEKLGLTYNPYSTQIECHDYIGELCDVTARFNTTLLDMDRDMWAYVSRGLLKLKVVAGEVGSSTMPHKVNPIDFENSEGNAGVANALLGHLAAKLPVCRLQRDLSDSTVLRCLGMGFAHSLLAVRATQRGLSRSTVDADAIAKELAPQWALLGEAVQTIMRKHGVPNAYEKLKELTRGQEVTAETMRVFLETLDIPADDKAILMKLSPGTYTGLAAELAKAI
jgi:adenylosuccinate lyase